MKKKLFISLLSAALMLSLAACGKAPAAESEAPAAEPQVTEAVSDVTAPQTPEVASDAAEPARQDGDRFEAVIIMEGMEETVQYEHLRNEALGFEMDYEYESFARESDSERERFVSVWDDPNAPENYLEIAYNTGNSELVASAISATLSGTYDTTTEEYELDGAGTCLRIEAAVLKGTNNMADQLQEVYIIPAHDGCLVATAHFSIEAAEGFGHRFAYMLNTLSVLG